MTGLADVMDIVHKFLNRDVEHEQLKSSVKEAEAALRPASTALLECGAQSTGRPIHGQTSRDPVRFRGLPVDRSARR